MKVRPIVASAYQEQLGPANLLQRRVDDIFLSRPPDWHYFSRVKSEQSFALKLETGRTPQPSALEDFFACTIVVPTASSIPKGIEFTERYFIEVAERRPPRLDETSKPASDFRFDDLRLYTRLKPGVGVEESTLNDITFEIQVKTFLQHAWSIATHDLIYKGRDVDWARIRVGFQIKALLEHAETSIAAIEDLGRVPVLPANGSMEIQERTIMDAYRQEWEEDSTSQGQGLPLDERRLAQNTRELLNLLKIDVAQLPSILQEGRERLGAHPISMSPFQALIGYLIRVEKAAVRRLAQEGRVNGRPKKGKEYHLTLTEEQFESLGITPKSEKFYIIV
jgi:hypothetical protein